MQRTPSTFYGNPIVNLDIFSEAISFTPDRDVPKGGFVKVGEGYAIADAATRAGERGTFRISGEFLFETHPDYKIEDNSYAALDLETGRIVPRGTPNSFGDIDVNLVSPPTPKEPGFAICHFSQPYHP